MTERTLYVAWYTAISIYYYQMGHLKLGFKDNKHRAFNDILSVIVGLVAIYILVIPILPQIQLWWDKRNDKTGGYVYETKLVDKPEIKKEQKKIPKGKKLVLPTIQLNEKVHEGPNFWTLEEGLWRLPHTSTPDKGGNTVIVGHRFSYSDPAVFYHLDKIKVGDKFPLYWDGTEYDYEVFDISVVTALDLSVEAPTDESILTMYTCTPLVTATHRLVVKSRLIEDTV